MTQFFIPLTGWSLLQFQGLKTKAFLQGQFTIHLETCNINQVMLAAYCNPKGRVISLFYFFYINENYYCLMPSTIALRMQEILKPYAALSRVNINLVTDVSIWGLDEFTLKNNVTFSNIENNIYHLNTQDIIFPVLQKNATYQRYIWISKHAPSIPFTNTLDHWHLADLEIGIPWFNEKNSEIFLPQELQLIQKNAVQLNKGCYVGQEIISRIHYRSQFKRELYIIKSNDPILINNDIFYEHQTVGKIIDVTHILNGQNIYFALGTLNTTFALNSSLFADAIHKQPLELVRIL